MSSLDPLYKSIVIEENVVYSDSTVDFVAPSGWGTPTFAIVLWGQSNIGAGAPRTAAWNFCGVGFWTSGGQHSVGFSEESGAATSNSARYSSTTRAVAIPTTSAGALQFEYTASAITDGIRLTKNTNATTATKAVHVMMFRGSSIKNARVGYFNGNATAPVNHILNGGGGWPVNYVLTLSCGLNAVNTLGTDARFSFGWVMKNINGAGTGTFKQGCMAYYAGDASATSEVQHFISNTYCIAELSGLGSVQTGLASNFFTSGSNDGFAWSAETFTATSYVFYLALELETSLVNDPDLMVERMSGWYFDEAASSNLSKSNLTMDADNFAGMGICAGSSNTAVDTVEGNGHGSNNFTAACRLSVRDSSCFHGGFAWVSEDGVTTMNCGGHTHAASYWRMPPYNAYNGREWEGTFFDRVGGGELVLNQAYDTLSTDYKEQFIILAFGRGVREIYKGDELVGLANGYTTNIDVYKGSTKLYGDPDFDNSDRP